MKFVIVAISTAALIASAPTIFAQGDVQHGSRPRNAGPRLQEGKPGASGYLARTRNAGEGVEERNSRCFRLRARSDNWIQHKVEVLSPAFETAQLDQHEKGPG
jgi:hypothetical protein